MQNKCWYLFDKDRAFRQWVFLTGIGGIACLILLQMNITQNKKLNYIRRAHIVMAMNLTPKTSGAAMNNTEYFSLNGIMHNKDYFLAIVNGQLIKTGDEIDGKRVTRITAHEVTLCDMRSAEKCISLTL